MVSAEIITVGELTPDTKWILIIFAIIALLSWLLSIVWSIKYHRLRKKMKLRNKHNERRTEDFFYE